MNQVTEADLTQSCRSIHCQTDYFLSGKSRYAALWSCAGLKAEKFKVAFKGHVDNDRMLKTP